MLKRNKRTPDTADGQRTDSGRTRRQRRADSRTDKRATRTDGRTLSGAVSGAPRWVGWFTDIGRPLSAITVMVLCAPGERHLAELAGWGPNLSWGMAGLLVMYAGIAAVVATVRPKGAPGKKTAVLGAILSLVLAMAAQPVSHYFVTGWMSDSPRAPFWLVTVVSCVPPFVMGHLLHLAADPGTETAPDGGQDHADTAWDAEVLRKAYAAREHARADDGETEGAQTAAQAATAQRRADYVRTRMSETVTAEEAHPGVESMIRAGFQHAARFTPGDDLSADAMRWQPDGEVQGGHGVALSGYVPDVPLTRTLDIYPVADSGSSGLAHLSALRSSIPDMVSARTADGRTDTEDGQIFMSGHPDTRTDGHTGRTQADSGQRTDGQTGRTDAGLDLSDPDAGQDMATFIRDTWTLNPDMDRADMRTAVRRSFPDKKADAVRKAVARAEEAMRS
jgi:hypothetical protein